MLKYEEKRLRFVGQTQISTRAICARLKPASFCKIIAGAQVCPSVVLVALNGFGTVYLLIWTFTLLELLITPKEPVWKFLSVLKFISPRHIGGLICQAPCSMFILINAPLLFWSVVPNWGRNLWVAFLSREDPRSYKGQHFRFPKAYSLQLWVNELFSKILFFKQFCFCVGIPLEV